MSSTVTYVTLKLDTKAKVSMLTDSSLNLNTNTQIDRNGGRSSTNSNKQYKFKCTELDEALAYLGIEAEQNSMLETKTVELQHKVEHEVSMIKTECEDIILERETLQKQELELLQDAIDDKIDEIHRLTLACHNLEQDVELMSKQFKRDLTSKQEQFEYHSKQLANKTDTDLQHKIDTILGLERKSNKLKLEHQEQVNYLNEQIDKYKAIAQQSQAQVEQSNIKAESLQQNKRQELQILMLEKQLSSKTRETDRLQTELEGFQEIVRDKEYYFRCAKDNQEYIVGKANDEIQSLRKSLLDEQAKNQEFKTILQQKEFFEQQYELLKSELIKEKSKDTEARLDCKVRELQRQVSDMQLLMDSKDSAISQLQARLTKYDCEFVSEILSTHSLKWPSQWN